MAAAAPRIFVSIASYRDVQCQHTVRDLFATAARPDLVTVGICWQYLPGRDAHCFELGTRPGQVRCVAYDALDSRGACWAKAEALALREDEPYVLHIDSHMRFHPGWDAGLVEMLRACPAQKPVLSVYPAPFVPPRTGPCQTPRMTADRFDADGVLVLGAIEDRFPRPLRGAFMAGGFVFSEASLWDEVPYDPALYFIGEEVTVSARAFTNGWDVYHPPVCVIHHQYEREAVRHWDDHKRWTHDNARSLARVRHMLGAARSTDPAVIEGLDGPMGLGRVRSLAAFEAFAGVDFQRQTISPRAHKGRFELAPASSRTARAA